MITLPTWLAIYLSIGILFTYGCSCIQAFNKAYRSGYRARTGRDPGAIACGFIALTCIALWPVCATVFAAGAVCGMARVMRDW